MKTRFLITIALCGIAEYYSFVIIRSALKPLSPAWRIVITSLYLLLSAAAWVSVLFLKQINWDLLPDMLRNFTIAFVMGFFIGKLLIAFVMLLDDVRRIFLWAGLEMLPERKAASKVAGNGISRSLFLKQVALLLGATALGGFIYGISNRYNYRIKRISLKLDNLPAAFRGLKILQLSDIHAGSFDNPDAVAKGVATAMEEQADIIFFTGDLVNNTTAELKPYMDIFSRLRAPMGVYSILGNHDYGDYVTWPSEAAKMENLETMKAAQQQMGWRLLLNEHVVLEKDNECLAVIGIENWSAKLHFPRHGDLTQAYAGLEEAPVPLKILLSHDPSHWDAQVTSRFSDIDLTLSGHTHGMQFGVEIPGFKWSPVKYVYQRWAGLYRQGKQHLYVNRGFGFLGYPGRLGILPEITVIELT